MKQQRYTIYSGVRKEWEEGIARGRGSGEDTGIGMESTDAIRILALM
jgi:hypothetical protein